MGGSEGRSGSMAMLRSTRRLGFIGASKMGGEPGLCPGIDDGDAVHVLIR